MKYLISKFDCKMIGDHEVDLIKNVKYEIAEFSNFYLILTSGQIVYIDLNKNENVQLIRCHENDYYFLFPPKIYISFCTVINFQNKEFVLTVGDNIILSQNGEVLSENKNENLTYSHYEIINNLCFVYLIGKRNFVVIFNEKEVVFANFYDEFNNSSNERFYLCKLQDCLNHGKVFHIKDKEVENYLVYLDNYDLNLKDEFVGNVFLDCLLAGNYKYCNELLSTDLKFENAENIKNFFEDFDEFYPLGDNEFILFKKNTLAGIYKFEVLNLSISNIMNQM